jgi:hypothetical protein
VEVLAEDWISEEDTTEHATDSHGREQSTRNWTFGAHCHSFQPSGYPVASGLRF